MFEGKGRLIDENGNVSQGLWKYGLMNGRGFFYEKETRKITEGFWLNG